MVILLLEQFDKEIESQESFGLLRDLLDLLLLLLIMAKTDSGRDDLGL
jgi:hypothetical protein